jgi:hypothetical protein
LPGVAARSQLLCAPHACELRCHVETRVTASLGPDSSPPHPLEITAESSAWKTTAGGHRLHHWSLASVCTVPKCPKPGATSPVPGTRVRDL